MTERAELATDPEALAKHLRPQSDAAVAVANAVEPETPGLQEPEVTGVREPETPGLQEPEECN